MSDGRSVYSTFGATPVLNAAGTKTRIGGSRIRPDAADAMRAAARDFVPISELQARAADRIADVTGAESGYVTSGAFAGMTLSAAACIAGTDPVRMASLPSTDGFADEIVVPREHKTSYDRAYELAGATLVDVGTNDRTLGTGASNVWEWELDAAIGPDTAAVAYLQKEYTDPPLETVVEVAHDNDVPVIVDAAAELPPVSNLERFVDAGADLVVFSGGKGIRGPQTTGIVAGRRDLISSIAAQQLDMHVAPSVWEPPEAFDLALDPEAVPRQGIGRGMKVGKEELVGLLSALESFVDEDYDETAAEWGAVAESIADRLSAAPDVRVHVDDGDASVCPEVVVTHTGPTPSDTAVDVVRGLQSGDPRVQVGTDDLDAGQLRVNPMCLHDDEVDDVVDRVLEELERVTA